MFYRYVSNGDGNAAIHSGGGLPVVGDGGSLDGITFSAGSVTLQITVLYSIGFKYVMVV
jgi:hypothetical protein